MNWDNEGRVHILQYETPDGPKVLRSRAVLLSVPANVAAELLAPLGASAILKEIHHPSVAAITLEYPVSAFRKPSYGLHPADGFGQLHPRSQGLRSLGIIYGSSLFPMRAPDTNTVQLHMFLGGGQDPALFGGIDGMTEVQLVEDACKDVVKTLLKPSAAGILPKVLGVRMWDSSIPQFELGHWRRIERIYNSLNSSGVPGIFLLGSYANGISLASVVECGLKVGCNAANFVTEARARK